MLTAEEARALTDDIRSRVTDLLPRIQFAFAERADQALGYPSWEAYCAAELSGLRVPLGDRPTMVAELRQSGMSQRAIGAALGVDAKTVRNDLASTGEYSPVAQPEQITSLDGRKRPAQTGPPRPASRRPAGRTPRVARTWYAPPVSRARPVRRWPTRSVLGRAASPPAEAEGQET